MFEKSKTCQITPKNWNFWCFLLAFGFFQKLILLFDDFRLEISKWRNNLFWSVNSQIYFSGILSLITWKFFRAIFRNWPKKSHFEFLLEIHFEPFPKCILGGDIFWNQKLSKKRPLFAVLKFFSRRIKKSSSWKINIQYVT